MKTLLSLLLLVLGINIANSQISINGCTYTPMPQDYSYMYKYLDYSLPDLPSPFDYTESYPADNLKSKEDYTVDALCIDDEKIVSLKVTVYTYQSGNQHIDCFAVKNSYGWYPLKDRVNISKLQDAYNELTDVDTRKLILNLMEIGKFITVIDGKIYIL